MKIYIVFELFDNGETCLMEIFSTKKGANNYVKDQIKEHGEHLKFDIIKRNVDSYLK